MGYTPSFTPPYEDGWEDLPLEETPITAEVLNAYDDAIVNVENYLATIDTEVNTNTTGQFNTITGGILNSCVINLEPVQSGSGTPSPSNVRPITGHSSVEVGNVGKNLVYIENGTIINDATKDNATNIRCRTGNMNYIQADTDYVISASSTTEKNVQISYQTWTSNSFGGNTKTYDSGWQNTPTVINISSSAWITSVFKYSDGSVIDSNDLMIQFEKGSRVTTYEPYQGQDITISLGQTVYGGTLDVVSGKFTGIVKKKVLNGSENDWFKSGSSSIPQGRTGYYCGNSIFPDCVYAYDDYNRANVVMLFNNFVGNGFSAMSAAIMSSFAIGIGISGGKTDIWVNVDATECPDVTSFRTWLSNNPIEAVYPLETPIEIQLTPQQIETLIGQNNISVPLEGQSLDELTYREMMAWDDVEKAVENYVEANPTETATDSLTKINIGGQIYEIEGGGGGSDVSITPTLSTGTKIADFEIDGVEGELYAPTGGGGNANIWTGTQAELEEVFDELEEGTQINITDDEQEVVEGGTIYSEEEQVIGLWTDNKPLYQKTIPFNALTSGANNKINSEITITNYKIVEFSGTVFLADGVNELAIPYVTSNQQLSAFFSDGVYVFVSSNLSVSSGYLTITYTKNADSPLDAVVGKSTMYIASSDCYSTEEKEVGCWHNGKPLYQKSYIFTSGWSLGNWSALANLASLNIDDFVSSNAKITRTGDIQLTFNGSLYPESSNATNYKVSVRYNGGNLEVLVVTYDNITQIVVTIQYTKTTDTAGSGQYTPASGKAVHYSTDEQVIGTWVDGSTIYQKTVLHSGVIVGAQTATQIAHGITNLGRIIQAEATVYDDHSSPSWMSVPRIAYDANNIGFSGIDNTYINFYVPSAFGNRIKDAHFVLTYTKSV